MLICVTLQSYSDEQMNSALVICCIRRSHLATVAQGMQDLVHHAALCVWQAQLTEALSKDGYQDVHDYISVLTVRSCCA